MWKVFNSLASISNTSCNSILSIIRSLIVIHITRWSKLRSFLQKRSSGGLIRDNKVISEAIWSKSVEKQVEETRQLISLLVNLNLLPSPLSKIVDIITFISPADISGENYMYFLLRSFLLTLSFSYKK